MTFDPNNALRFGLGFFLPNLVAIGHIKAIWPLLDPGWPLHDLWPQQCITLWSGVLPTKLGSQRAYSSILTSGWPWLTPAWPLTPAMPQKSKLDQAPPTHPPSLSLVHLTVSEKKPGQTNKQTHRELRYFYIDCKVCDRESRRDSWFENRLA